MHIVIRAGGAGTRLWPLSRQACPKQFLPVISNRTMIAATFDRVAAIAGPDTVFISVNRALVDRLRSAVPNASAENFIIEPEARNTGPAMCLETCILLQRLSPEAIVASLPSDDYISDEAAFHDVLEASEHFIKSHPEYIVTPAVKPEYPEVGYSYLRAGEVLENYGEEVLYRVTDIAEKPNAERCEELIESGIYYWHTGMYIWKLGRIAELYKQYQPAMFDVCTRIASLMGSTGAEAEVAELYASLEKMSIESAITDRIDSLAMSVSNRFGWSDVGKWPAVKRITGEAHELTIREEAEGNLVISTDKEKLIVLNHVDNLAVIDTGDVLLVSRLDETEAIKAVIEKLKRDGKENYL